ncbi:MAG TPA: ABC transporter permease [Ornithinibacter sp.]|nr:ABC transporter permease [Ornithinibacter sp.]
MSTVATAGRAFVGRSLRHSVRDVEVLVMAVSLPVMLMLVFTYVFGGAITGEPATYAAYVTPGTVLLCAGFGAASTSVGVATDLAGGMVDRLRRMPVPAWTVLVGHVVASLVRNLVATAIVLGVGVLLGYRPDAGVLGWIGAVAVISVWVLAVTAVFAVIGLVAGSPEAANGYGFAVLFLPYVSSAFVPVATLPTWLQGVGEHQPVTPVIESVRALLDGAYPGADLWWAMAWSVGLLGAALVLAAVMFPRRRSRRS